MTSDLLQTFLAFTAGVATWDGLRTLWRRTRRPKTRVHDVLTDQPARGTYVDAQGRPWLLVSRSVDMPRGDQPTTMRLELLQGTQWPGAQRGR